MELRNHLIIPVGIAIAIALIVFMIVRSATRQNFKGGVKAANLDLLHSDPYIKRKYLEHKIYKVVLITSIIGVIISSCICLARPYIVKMSQENKYTRDIIICMDVSTSVNELNMKLTKELQDTVRQLKGERVGIVMFNTSPVLVSPLSDDYEYTIEQLENIRTAIKVTDSTFGTFDEDWSYWNDFLFTGTLVGNEERGSSLIGDGLLGAVFNFSKYEPKRTKIVIFATDNDPYGDPYASLPEAAEICKKNNITVYGIGTKEMTKANMDEMEQAMLATGGKFYLEENSLTFNSIIEDIESQSADLVKGKTVIKEIEQPETAFTLICIFVALSIVFGLLLLQADLPWLIRKAAAILVVIALFVMYVNPAIKHFYGNDSEEVKANSDLNVLFVVDTTLSMVAQDYNGNEERLTGVKQDCTDIINELSGAKFSVVSFNNVASIVAPYSTNSDYTKNVIYSLTPVDSIYAKGTNINVTKDKLLEILSKSSQDEKQKTIVFFISDGEATTEDMNSDYKELAPYISGGAVLGYGTKQGGYMYTQKSYEDEPVQVMDKSVFPYEEAVSKIDEDNLQRIASDMGVDYINMNSKTGFESLLNRYKSDIHVTYEVQEKEDKQEEESQVTYKFENNWWMLALLILGLYVYEGVMVIRKR